VQGSLSGAGFLGIPLRRARGHETGQPPCPHQELGRFRQFELALVKLPARCLRGRGTSWAGKKREFESHPAQACVCAAVSWGICWAAHRGRVVGTHHATTRCSSAPAISLVRGDICWGNQRHCGARLCGTLSHSAQLRRCRCTLRAIWLSRRWVTISAGKNLLGSMSRNPLYHFACCSRAQTHKLEVCKCTRSISRFKPHSRGRLPNISKIFRAHALLACDIGAR